MKVKNRSQIIWGESCHYAILLKIIAYIDQSAKFSYNFTQANLQIYLVMRLSPQVLRVQVTQIAVVM